MKQKKLPIIYAIGIIIILLIVFVFHNIIKKDTIKDSTRFYCSSESRNVDACIEIYQPVCGWNNSSKLQCIKYPCAETYSNSCFACQNPDVEYYTKGECPE